MTGDTVLNTPTDQVLRSIGNSIDVYQAGYLSATTVSGNSVTGVTRNGIRVIVQSLATASPVVRETAVSNSGFEPFYVASNQLIPANLTGNTGTASTRQGMVWTGTLVASLTLPFGALPMTLDSAPAAPTAAWRSAPVPP